MLGENIKTLRKNKGLTQEELATRLNVVRQTVSKWEKGFSVPDADILQRIAEILEVDVKLLLGSDIELEADSNSIADQLSRLNEQLAVKNRRSRKIRKIVGIVLIIVAILVILSGTLSRFTFENLTKGGTETSGNHLTIDNVSSQQDIGE